MYRRQATNVFSIVYKAILFSVKYSCLRSRCFPLVECKGSQSMFSFISKVRICVFVCLYVVCLPEGQAPFHVRNRSGMVSTLPRSMSGALVQASALLIYSYKTHFIDDCLRQLRATHPNLDTSKPSGGTAARNMSFSYGYLINCSITVLTKQTKFSFLLQ